MGDRDGLHPATPSLTSYDELCHVPRTVPHLEAYARWLHRVLHWAAHELSKMGHTRRGPSQEELKRLRDALVEATRRPSHRIKPYYEPELPRDPEGLRTWIQRDKDKGR